MTSRSSFQETQFSFAAHIRHPKLNDAPKGIEDRRMEIYRNLFYNNIESFIASGFPILRSIFEDESWHKMVRDFVHRHESHSPYFLEISQEFLHYLQEEHEEEGWEPPFLLELAHYEWVELALDVATETIPEDVNREGDVLEDCPVVSPLAWRLPYQYPVHKLGPSFQPEAPGDQPTFLIVYRNRKMKVQFMESNAATLRLLQLLEDGASSGRAAILQLAEEMQQSDKDALLQYGAGLLQQLLDQDIICGFRRSLS